MKLIDAIILAKKESNGSHPAVQIALACGFTPLHLKVFLEAHARDRFPEYRTEVQTGDYGDLLGNIKRAEEKGASAIVVIVEWADIDQRLDLRSSGSWQIENFDDIAASATKRLSVLAEGVVRAAKNCPVVVCGPTLPFPPLPFSPEVQAGTLELSIRADVSRIFLSLASEPGIKMLSEQYLDERSAPKDRLDADLLLMSGFPYKTAHSDVLAEQCIKLLYPAPLKKALITDLDNTLWKGILGDLGADGISWSLEEQAHVHAIYQRSLAALASAGILIGIASKNDMAMVTDALARKDLLLNKDAVFPVVANWGPKSQSIAGILKAWNIGADAVVFVDDSPMELAEVKEAFPEIAVEQFPAKGEELLRLLKKLQQYFGKNVLQAEDKLRLQSIKASVDFQSSASGEDTGFVQRLDATVTVSTNKDLNDARPLELINKTNQFNLNGKRISDAEWTALLKDKNSFVLTVSYQDKFGPLGKISVVTGTVQNDALNVSSWVLSCRAFSRNIEHHVMRWMFEHFNVPAMRFDYAKTDRNGPITDFLSRLGERSLDSDVVISRADFDRNCTALTHVMQEEIHAQ